MFAVTSSGVVASVIFVVTPTLSGLHFFAMIASTIFMRLFLVRPTYSKLGNAIASQM